MKKLLSLFILMLLPMLASAQTASDVQNSGCLSKTRGEETQMEPTIILTKEGSTLSVQLLNYESNCATQDFNVSSSINGEGGIYGVSVDINPVLPELVTSCLCPFNISFTIHDLEPNSFYFNCWWYKGQVELTEGEPMVMAYKTDVKINEENFPDENFRNWVLSAAVDRNKNHILDDDEIQRVTDIDVHQKKIVSLKGIEYFTELHILTCYQNSLTELDLSKNTKLDTLNCPWNELTSLNVKNCSKLEWIRCDQNKLTELDVSGCTELKLLVCSGNNLTALDVSSCTKLDDFDCGGNNLTALDLSNNTELTKLGCGMNHLATLDLSNNTKLMECSCSGNAMTRLILSKDNVLYSLVCSTNQLYGAAMEHIVENLNYQRGGFLAVFNAENKEQEKNVITTTQVAALNAKGWKVYQWIYSEYCTYLGSEAKDDYRPLVEEGKHWTYDNYMPLRPEKYDHYYYYDLKGDTLIAGLHCLKMYSENSYNNNAICYEGALYEVNKKVYCFFPEKNQAELLYDFDCTVGDTIQVREGQLAVKDIRTEDNGGIAIRKYILMPVVAAEDYMGEIFWVEGVGASKDFFGMLPLDGNYNTLNACELNGEKLYQTIESDYTEAGYHKMAIEGKRWNYIHYHLENDGWHEEPYSYVVKGDTIIRRTTYKKLYYQDAKTERFACLLLERGRTVYKNTDFGNNSYDSPVLTTFFEFDREDFGRVFTWKAKNNSGNTNWMVYGVDTVEVNNRQFRRYTCLQKYSEESETLTTIKYDGEGVWHDIWVEGVGSASRGIEDQYPSHEPQVRSTSDYTTFVSCYENGECIFTADDFNVQTYTKPDVNIAYRPFIEEGKVWKVGTIPTALDSPVQVVDYYYFDGDTIIGGKTCKQMMCQRYVSPNYSNEYWTPRPSLTKVGAWYEEDKKVYSFDEREQTMTLKYDFSLEANDTLHFLNEDGYPPFIIGPKQTGGLEGFKGVYREIMIGQDMHNTIWLEGVGVRDAPFRNAYDPRADLVPEFLISCTVGDEIIYLNDRYEDEATPESMGARKNRFDFTHTIKTKPKARKRSEEEPLLYGEYNNLKLGINLNPLDDAYQVRITDESGKVVYEKTVNAGNIVGLNIDISAYAKGRYTVTVENSNESFTGEFETQTTGIEAIKANKEDVRSYIYNLHGQRLSTLQKGLNIVNGQKIYVK